MRKSILAVVLILSVPRLAQGLMVLEPGYTIETYAEYSPTTTHTYSMTFDASGNLYLDQPFDDKIWRVLPDGTASQFVSISNTTSGLDWTGGTAYGDFLYVTANTTLQKIAPDGSVSTFAVGFPAASEVAVDVTGNYGGQLYVSTGGQDHIYRVDTTGGVSMFSSWPGWTNGGGPVGMEFDLVGDYGGLMYVATSFGNNASTKSGIFSLNTNGAASRFADSLVVGRELGFDTGGLFGNDMFAAAADAFDEEFSIWRVAPDGSATEFAVTTKSRIGSLVFGPDGALYVSEYSADKMLITVSRVVPEPTTLLLFGLGGVAFLRKRTR